jgi:hypothetical protein
MFLEYQVSLDASIAFYVNYVLTKWDLAAWRRMAIAFFWIIF